MSYIIRVKRYRLARTRPAGSDLELHTNRD